VREGQTLGEFADEIEEVVHRGRQVPRIAPGEGQRS